MLTGTTPKGILSVLLQGSTTCSSLVAISRYSFSLTVDIFNLFVFSNIGQANKRGYGGFPWRISHIKLSQGAFRRNPPGSLVPVSLLVGFPDRTFVPAKSKPSKRAATRAGEHRRQGLWVLTEIPGVPPSPTWFLVKAPATKKHQWRGLRQPLADKNAPTTM